MKKTALALILLMLAVFCFAAASADVEGYWVDLPDEVYADLNGFVNAYFTVPSGGQQIIISCSDSSAFRNMGIGYTSKGSFLSFQMTALGEYTVHFTAGDAFNKDIQIIVETPATAIHMEQDPMIVEVGQTVPFRYTTEGGSLHNPLRSYNSEALSFDLWADPMTLTGQQTGMYTVNLSQGLGSFEVYVVDHCENVQIS